ncbi:hypothetical protein RDI58_006711 [Solanum bulbocastanum]|uniref:Uncharacterized protein n=1 Tax=Solanum bulbocastanum TaxID=147425 RepID=A0AAN8YLE1_SOLBU
MTGITWLKSLLFTLVNRMKHSVFEQNHPLLVKNPHVLVPFLEHTLYVDGRVPDFYHLLLHLDFWQLMCHLLHCQNLFRIQKPNLFTWG